MLVVACMSFRRLSAPSTHLTAGTLCGLLAMTVVAVLAHKVTCHF